MNKSGCARADFAREHVVNVMLTGNRDAYFANYNGTAEELAVTLERGWLFSGQVQKTTGRVRGGDPTALKPEQLVYCISNHDLQPAESAMRLNYSGPLQQRLGE